MLTTDTGNAGPSHSIDQALGLANSFQSFVEGLKHQHDSEKAKTNAQAAQLVEQSRVIIRLNREYNLLKEEYHTQAQEHTKFATTSLMRDLADERMKNAQLQSTLDQMNKERVSSSRDEVVAGNQKCHHADKLAQTIKKHDAAIEDIRAKANKKITAQIARVKAFQDEVREKAAEVRESRREAKEAELAKLRAEKEISRAKDRAEKEIEQSKRDAEKSEAKAQKYERVFESARWVVRSDANRDWEEFGKKMRELSEAVKSHG